MSRHPKELSRETVERFQALVPSARAHVGDSLAKLTVDGREATVRIKRALTIANQVQVWRGEPIAVHVPSEDGESERWFVLPVPWQLSYARRNATTANQHASHAFDCMMIGIDALPDEHEVTPATILAACEEAAKEATSREIRFIVKAISRARNAVANVLIETLEEEFGTTP